MARSVGEAAVAGGAVGFGVVGGIGDVAGRRRSRCRVLLARRCNDVGMGYAVRRVIRMEVKVGRVKRSRRFGLRWWASDLAVDYGKDFYVIHHTVSASIVEVEACRLIKACENFG